MTTEYILHIILLTLGWGFSACLVLFFVFLCLQFIDAIFQRYRKQGKGEGWCERNSEIMSQSWWFSEDEATMEMLQRMAKDRDVSQNRDEWRRARDSKKEEKP
jgi:uncharacterized protein (DUF2235 family)